jgi:hypothetical protein
VKRDDHKKDGAKRKDEVPAMFAKPKVGYAYGLGCGDFVKVFKIAMSRIF